MNPLDAYLAELKMESQATRRLLDAVPGDKLDWKPHEKSMSLGELANHIATCPGPCAGMALMDVLQAEDFKPTPLPNSKAEILENFEASVAEACKIIESDSPENLDKPFAMKAGDQVLFSCSRGEVYRVVLLNHWYHHRGQLTVYLRLLDVPVPPTYGPTADVQMG